MIRPALALLALTLPATAAEHHCTSGDGHVILIVAAAVVLGLLDAVFERMWGR